MEHGVLGYVLALTVGVILGLLGGGGSILALPIFLYVFKVPTKPAVAMSLAVVGMSAFVGFLTHWRQGTVAVRVALPFGGLAMLGAFATARVAERVPAPLQLGLFGVFALTAALRMIRDSRRPSHPGVAPRADGRPFPPLLAVQAVAVGVLTALIGAGGGFLIVPTLVLLAGVPVRVAVGTSLLVITMNALAGFAGYLGEVAINWRLVSSFTGVAAVGAVVGTMLVPRVSQRALKQSFAVLVLGIAVLVLTRAWVAGH